MTRCLLIVLAAFTLVSALATNAAAQTSSTDRRLQRALQQYPAADANGDGVLTLEEALAYLNQSSGGKTPQAEPGKSGFNAAAALLNRIRPAMETEVFQATAAELDAAMKAENAANSKDPLQYPRGNGLRIVSTGHSWVGPALRTLPQIAAAAGYDGQRIRSHTGGGGTGSANSIWRKELGKYGDQPARPILLPAIATGEWDVMTWGGFLGDSEAHYAQWIEVCLQCNPQMRFYVQDGWPTFDDRLNGMASDAALQEIDAFYKQMQDAMIQPLWSAIDARYPGKVKMIPAGAAVVEMLHRYYAQELPGFDCVSEHLGGKCGIFRDGGHLSRSSGLEWLDGYVYFGMLYGKSPELITGWQPPNVHHEVDRAMRQAAWKAITNSPFSGLRDANGDGLADADPPAAQ